MLDSFLCWIESHPGLAAWVQVGGTFIALTIAIGVPWRLHKNEAKERAVDRRNQGRGIALLIRSSLYALDNDMEQVILGAGYIPFANMVVEVPKGIKDEVGRLWLMGGAAASNTQHLISQIEAHNGYIATTLIWWSKVSANGRAEYIKLAVARLEIARNSLKSALVAIEKLTEN